MRILITESMDPTAVAEMVAAAEVTYDASLAEDMDRLLALASEMDGLIVRNQTKVTKDLLSAAPRLKVIGRLGVGLDNIDTAYCREIGVAVIPAVGANAVSVAEYVIAASLILTRRCFLASDAVRAGRWPRADLSKGSEIRGRVLGLVGFGSIGQEVAQLAKGIGLSAIAHDPTIAPQAAVWAKYGVRPVTLPELAASADIVSLHVPLVPATYHLFGAALLGQLKPDAVLINTSRGGVVDEQALAAALKTGALAGAALDVFECEPLRAIDLFDGIGNLIFTPHVAGVTQESNLRISKMIAHAVLNHLSGTDGVRSLMP